MNPYIQFWRPTNSYKFSPTHKIFSKISHSKMTYFFLCHFKKRTSPPLLSFLFANFFHFTGAQSKMKKKKLKSGGIWTTNSKILPNFSKKNRNFFIKKFQFFSILDSPKFLVFSRVNRQKNHFPKQFLKKSKILSKKKPKKNDFVFFPEKFLTKVLLYSIFTVKKNKKNHQQARAC